MKTYLWVKEFLIYRVHAMCKSCLAEMLLQIQNIYGAFLKIWKMKCGRGHTDSWNERKWGQGEMEVNNSRESYVKPKKEE